MLYFIQNLGFKQKKVISQGAVIRNLRNLIVIENCKQMLPAGYSRCMCICSVYQDVPQAASNLVWEVIEEIFEIYSFFSGQAPQYKLYVYIYCKPEFNSCVVISFVWLKLFVCV